MRMSLTTVAFTILLLTPVADTHGANGAPTPAPTPATTHWLAEAEQHLYDNADPEHLAKTSHALHELEKVDPKNPYIFWARARVAFWKKEPLYLVETTSENAHQIEHQKLALGDECHQNADRCLEIAPKNAECHLMKGVCYAMQASTWGSSLKTLRILDPMDDEFKNSIDLPSSFVHMGEVATRRLGLVLRGILYRAMPDSWWFGLVAGMRGNKEKAYQWIKEAAYGRLLQEPVVRIELGASALCLGKRMELPEKITEGMTVLRDGLQFKTRYPLDDFDKKNMTYLIENPEKACSYRRERFEEVSDQSVRDTLKEKK